MINELFFIKKCYKTNRLSNIEIGDLDREFQSFRSQIEDFIFRGLINRKTINSNHILMKKHVMILISYQ